MMKNPLHKNLLLKFQFKKTNVFFRIFLFDLLLKNKTISELYFKLKSEEPYSTISVYDNRIRFDLI